MQTSLHNSPKINSYNQVVNEDSHSLTRSYYPLRASISYNDKPAYAVDENKRANLEFNRNS